MRSAIWLAGVFIALAVTNEANPSTQSVEATIKIVLSVALIFFIMDLIELFK